VVGAGVVRVKGLLRKRFLLNRFDGNRGRMGLDVGVGVGAGVTLREVEPLLMFRLRKKEDFLVRDRGRKVVGVWVVEGEESLEGFRANFSRLS